MKISAVVLTKNEERNIKDCLETLKFCDEIDEIIVIDDDSSDNTNKIVKSYGVKLFERKLSGDFAGQRNFGLDKAINEWVLFLDPDERITKDLSEEIKRAVNQNIFDGYYLKRIDNIWGKDLRHGECGNIKLLRLARRKAGRWERMVHEEWNMKGKKGILKNPIIHYPHQTLREFIGDLNYYSDLHAKANLKEGKKSNILKIIFYPELIFIRSYIIYLGFLDSIPGLLMALMMSMHSFLAWSKLWILQKKSS